MTKFPKPDKSESLPEQPWTIEADMIGTIRKIPKNESFDLVILRYLIAGDTRPLAWWLYEGHCPSPTTLKYIAYMLEPDNDNIPYKLITKSRTPKRGRPPKSDQDEVTTLRQENDRLREEVEILKKAAAYFASHPH